jgi:hypothetical protein
MIYHFEDKTGKRVMTKDLGVIVSPAKGEIIKMDEEHKIGVWTDKGEYKYTVIVKKVK